MTLIKRSRGDLTDYDPFAALSLLDQFWPAPVATELGFNPVMDVTETDSEYKVAIETPGVLRDDISIEFENGVLTISGEKKSTHEEKGERSYRIERRYGSFSRALSFRDVEGGKITASHKDGVLELIVPKSEIAQPRKITVE